MGALELIARRTNGGGRQKWKSSLNSSDHGPATHGARRRQARGEPQGNARRPPDANNRTAVSVVGREVGSKDVAVVGHNCSNEYEPQHGGRR